MVAVLRTAALVGLLLLSGCAISHKDTTLSLFQFGPGDEIQTAGQTITGLDVSPVGPGGPRVSLGYIRTQSQRIPAFDDGAVIPTVTSKTNVDGQGAIIGEELSVGQ